MADSNGVPDDADVARFARAVEQLDAVLTRAPNSGVQSVIHVNAGGVGVLIASVCCAVMFTITVIGGAVGIVAYLTMKQEFSEMRDDQRATKAYLQGIWQQAPHLKPEPAERGK